MAIKRRLKKVAGYIGLFLICFIIGCEPKNPIGSLILFGILILAIVFLSFAGIIQLPFRKDAQKSK
jgi:hypothetical protein